MVFGEILDGGREQLERLLGGILVLLDRDLQELQGKEFQSDRRESDYEDDGKKTFSVAVLRGHRPFPKKAPAPAGIPA
jgi:hypothetical protein